ncbi:MAG: hypothetical protein IKN62_05530 [Elusimicrobia bacterium]|nr:hypothetical protein [Elusimicrobiota bacterium]
MAKVSEITKPYFSHDESASQDGKILKMFRDFRKMSKEMSQEELESFVAVGAYGIFWRIVEFMHGNNLLVDDIDVLADDLRIDTKFVKQILDDYDLFHIEDDCYISDRIMRNLNKQQAKSENSRVAVQTRWLLSDFDKNYEDVFGKKPILSSEEIEALKKYSSQIEDLREKLPDLIYTLKGLKFETDTKFIPTANWLLKGNNLLRLYNGEFGKLKHKKTAKEIEEEQKKALEKQAEQSKDEIEFTTQINSIYNKSDAIAFIAKRIPHNADGKLFINPSLKPLCEKFDIIDREIKDFLNEQEEVF